MDNKFKNIIELCRRGIVLTEENVGNEMILVDRGSFQLVIPINNTDEHGYFFANSILGHDCYSYNSVSTHIYHIIEGTGNFIIGEENITVNSGDTITIEPNKIFAYEGNMIMTFEMIPNFKEENNFFVEKIEYKKTLKK